jgi:mannan endo-1,6-alpha-mannosidase
LTNNVLQTGDSTWKDRTNLLLTQTTKIFTSNNTNILYEVACESDGQCDVDQFFFKGLLARDLARTAQVAPFTASTIAPILQDSAKAAASVGCANGAKCVSSWQQGLLDSQPKDQVSNLGSQFSALQVIQQNLAGSGKALVGQSGSSSTNGTATSPSGIGSASASATANTGAKPLAVLGGVLVPILLVSGILVSY